MRVYLAAAMTNPDRDLDLLGRVLEHIEAGGHVVPTRHIVAPDGKQRDSALTDAELARRDLDWIAGCDALVAEVSTPSHGVGVEVMAALARNMPVLLLRREGIPVSRLLLGLPGVVTASYRSVGEASAAIDGFLAGVTL
jgi:hypothetical protein